jgi:cytochrome b involved in lipid metabolism
MTDFNPELKKDVLMSGYTWLENNIILDRIPENTWRIYDKLYDFRDFIDHHPGGIFFFKRNYLIN